MGRQRLAGREQHGRPVDGVEAQDALADDVHPTSAAPRASSAGRRASPLRMRAVIERGDVVGQRVDPDVHHLAGVARHRDPPAARPRPRAGDGEVLQARLDEAQHLVAPRCRDDAQPAAGDQVVELVAVAREAEEAVLLLDQLRHRAVVGAAAVDQLVLVVELLAADAVEPAVATRVEVPRRRWPARAGAPLQVAGVDAGADEVVVETSSAPQQLLERRA